MDVGDRPFLWPFDKLRDRKGAAGAEHVEAQGNVPSTGSGAARYDRLRDYKLREMAGKKKIKILAYIRFFVEFCNLGKHNKISYDT